MRHSFFALLVITLSLTACKVPKDLAADQDNVPDAQKNAIEERRKMQDVESDEPMEDHANMDHKNDEPMEDMKEKEMDSEVVSETSYTAFKDGVIGNGETSVLFFHASWCPACKKNDGLLTSWYGAEKFSRSVYKIDFDTATELRKQYGVNGQDTFVLIDGSGNEIERVSFPAQSALRALLG